MVNKVFGNKQHSQLLKSLLLLYTNDQEKLSEINTTYIYVKLTEKLI